MHILVMILKFASVVAIKLFPFLEWLCLTFSVSAYRNGIELGEGYAEIAAHLKDKEP